MQLIIEDLIPFEKPSNYSWFHWPQVQGKDPTMDTTQEMIQESEEERFDDGNDSSTMMMELPACELGKLEQISEVSAVLFVSFVVIIDSFYCVLVILKLYRQHAYQ